MATQALERRAEISETVLRVGEQSGYSRDKIELIKNTVAKDTNDDELKLFLMTAHRHGLDPFARQIYCIKRYDSRLEKNVAQTQTSIDGYRLIADRTERYAPGREPSYQYNPEGKLLSATAYVEKLVAGNIWKEVAATAFWDEYVQTNKQKVPTAMWQRMPHVMLAKCAESLALRKAFPAELSGLYTEDELGSTNDVQPTRPQPQATSSAQPVSASAAQQPSQQTVQPIRTQPPTRTPEHAAAHTVNEPLPTQTNKRALADQVVANYNRLNDLGDTPEWTGATLRTHVNEFFEVSDGLSALDPDAVQTYIAWQQQAIKVFEECRALGWDAETLTRYMDDAYNGAAVRDLASGHLAEVAAFLHKTATETAAF